MFSKLWKSLRWKRSSTDPNRSAVVPPPQAHNPTSHDPAIEYNDERPSIRINDPEHPLFPAARKYKCISTPWTGLSWEAGFF
jgi:hypothetical protein